LKFQAIVCNSDGDYVTRLELALKNFIRQRVLDLLLDGTLQRPRAVHRIESCIGKPVTRCIRQLYAHIALGEPIMQISKLDIDYQPNVLAV